MEFNYVSQKKVMYCLAIETPGRTWYIRADTEQEIIAWKAKIQVNGAIFKSEAELSSRRNYSSAQSALSLEDLVQALDRGDAAAVSMYLSSSLLALPPIIKEEEGLTPIHAAVKTKNISILLEFLEYYERKNLDINVKVTKRRCCTSSVSQRTCLRTKILVKKNRMNEWNCCWFTVL